jgi:hypothetical protein
MPQRPQRPTCRLVLAVLVLLPGVFMLPAGPAHAQTVGCGTVVTADFTLATDLLDCPEDGLVIGAPGITVDLGGHLVAAPETLSGDPEAVGIDNSAGHDGVTIRNGSVRYFGRGGVHLVGVDRSQVLDLEMFLFGEFGILLETGSRNRIAGNTVDTPTSVGIGIYGSAVASRDNVIEGNATDGAQGANIGLRYGRITGTVIQDNQATTGDSSVERWGASIAVSERDARTADISGTVVRRNRLDFTFGGGILVGPAAPGTLVERNRLDDIFGLPAIENEADRTLIRRNTITSDSFPGSTTVGVQVDAVAGDTRVEANTIDRAGAIGIDDSGTRTVLTANVMIGQIFPSEPSTGAIAGIIVREAASNGRIQANVVRRQAPGFAPDIGAGIWLSGDNFTVVANVVSEIDARDGIRVEPEATGTLLRANVTTRNGDDGIDVDSPATTVTTNVANDNEDLGIEAVAGVTDGGGNRARGNGNPAQCVGVRCA